MAGVAIGSVQSVKADPVKLDAEVTLAIDKRTTRFLTIRLRRYSPAV